MLLPWGVAKDFTTPVTYTVTAEDATTVVWTVTAVPSLDAGIAALNDATNGSSANDPVTLTLNGADLGNGGWAALLTAISGADKYVALDLSACTMGGTEFDPGTANNGESKIVSLVLPDVAKSVKAGNDENDAAFKNFTALTSVTGNFVETIDYSAFSNCTALETVTLPKVETIGISAFHNCLALVTIDLPATIIGGAAFSGCTALQEVTLPNATAIGFGEDSYGGSVFSGCTNLEKVTAPNATRVFAAAFSGCVKLKTVDLSEAETIAQSAFSSCSALETLSLPNAKNIGAHAFMTCTSLNTVTLGSTAPTLETGMGIFLGVTDTKTVTVKVPTTNSGYDETWKTKFKSGGANITLKIETY